MVLVAGLPWVTWADTTREGLPLRWSFDVFVDDRLIGEHSFELDSADEQLILTTKARFEVKVLFFTAFRYDHSNTEIWDENGLVRIDSVTDSNGDLYRVSGVRGKESFALSTHAGERVLPSEIMTFAYWNPAILEARQLLNSQTGEFLEVEVSEQGEEEVPFAEATIEARRYDLKLEQGPITLWYGKEDRRWTALESVTEGGRRLRYVPRELPSPFTLGAILE